MFPISFSIPEITSFPCYGKSYEDQIKTIEDRIEESLKKDTVYILNDDHGDLDAGGSAVIGCQFLDELKDKIGVGEKKYFMFPFNGTHFLSFSSTIFPGRLIKQYLEREKHVMFITADSTPWPTFFNQAEKFYQGLSDQQRENLEILDIEHHEYVERNKLKKLSDFVKGDRKTFPKTTYINIGWEKEAVDTWWKNPRIKCAGEILFDIYNDLMIKVHPQKRKTFIEKAAIPLLVATATDSRTEEAIEIYSEDKDIREAIRAVSKYKLIDKYAGVVTPMQMFLNKSNGALRISGNIDTPFNGLMNEDQIDNYPTHNAMYNILRSLYFAGEFRNPLALVTNPSEIGLPDHSPITEVLSLDKQHEKIKSGLRAAFLKWDFDRYVPRDDAFVKFDDTNIAICMIYGENRKIRMGRYKERREVDATKLLKVAPYMQYFLTSYYPISSLPAIAGSSFVISAVEGSPKDPDSYTQLSFRAPQGKEYPPVPLGFVTESLSNYMQKKYKLEAEEVSGGGKTVAAAARIQQSAMEKARAEYGVDKFEVINILIKEAMKRI